MRTDLRPLSFLLLALTLLGPAAARADKPAPPTAIPVYVAPAPSGSMRNDVDLARWALAAWQRASGGALRFVPAPEETALLRLYWVDGERAGGFGEMRPIAVGDHFGAEVYVNTNMDLLGPAIAAQAHADRLYRDTIVYLTCVHELGHGLGLSHTDAFDDIMYSFQYGGDIPGYFARYRRKLRARADIAKNDGLSAADVAHLREPR
ncbi:MAG TPA: matrixin family metalloprotease [Polyangia bacterium]|jgi:hypothetical protein|nr:matrixin family metalloprotease [Polyangia bacterium]